MEDPEEKAKLAEEKKTEYNDLFCNPYQAAQMGYIDDIIEPRNTRFRVIRALEQLAGKKQTIPAKKHDNLPAARTALNKISNMRFIPRAI